MASKQKIIDSINAGMERANATFGALTEEQLNRKVHAGEQGWTARQILAHLAGGQAAYDITFGMANGTVGVPSGERDAVDEFNRNVTDARLGMSRDALLQEFNAVNRSLIARVRDTGDESLAMEIESPSGTFSLGDLLIVTSGDHMIRHTQVVEQALGQDARRNAGS